MFIPTNLVNDPFVTMRVLSFSGLDKAAVMPACRIPAFQLLLFNSWNVNMSCKLLEVQCVYVGSDVLPPAHAPAVPDIHRHIRCHSAELSSGPPCRPRGGRQLAERANRQTSISEPTTDSIGIDMSNISEWYFWLGPVQRFTSWEETLSIWLKYDNIIPR